MAGSFADLSPKQDLGKGVGDAMMLPYAGEERRSPARRAERGGTLHEDQIKA